MHSVHYSKTPSSEDAFTLIELLVVIAIIAILSIVVILVLNPVDLLRQSRDSNRISDMASLNTVLGIFSSDQSAGSLGIVNMVYVSTPDSTATSTAGDQCQGLGLPTLPATYTYHCAATSTYQRVDGTGWIPVNLRTVSAGSPLSQLPIDPFNTSSSRNYYSYITNGTQYEVAAPLESQKYKAGGSGDVISNDGGSLASMYEKGSKLGLMPVDYGDASLIGYWGFEEGTGTVAYDYSGKNNTGTIQTGTWSAGKIGNFALSFPGTNSVNTNEVAISPVSSSLAALTVNVWINSNVSLSTGTYALVESANSPYTAFRISAGTLALRIDNWGGTGSLGQAMPGTYQNQWVMLSGTWDSSAQTIKLYVNGQSIVTGNGITSSAQNLAWPTAIGQYPNTWTIGLNGSIDNVRIYNRALSAGEVTALYNGGK